MVAKNIVMALACSVMALAGPGMTGGAQAAQKIPETLQKAGHLKVGVKCDAPPSGFMDQQGKLEGIDVDFSKYIAKNAFGDESKVKFTCVTSATRIQMLTSGKVDLIIATMSPTDVRKRVVDFTNSTNWGASGVLIKKGQPYHSLKDFNGKTLISTKGAWQAQYVQKNYPEIHLVLMDSLNDAVMALAQDRGDGLVQDVKALMPAASKYNSLALSDLRFGISWGAPAVRKGDDSLREYINKLIEQARKDGTFETSVKKYTSGPLEKVVLRGYLQTTAPDGSTVVNDVLR